MKNVNRAVRVKIIENQAKFLSEIQTAISKYDSCMHGLCTARGVARARQLRANK